MPKIIDETGNTYNNFKVIGLDLTNKSQRKKWLCECQNCKNIISVYGTNLRINKIPNCKICENNKFNNKKFGNLTIISYAYTEIDRHKYYKCKCDCGNTETIRGTFIFNGQRTQCYECEKKQRKEQYINEIGNKYGKLTVIEKFLHPSDTKNAWWICKCDCGNEIVVKGIKLRNGHTQSCGCLKSKGEEKINKILTDNKINYKTQVTFSDCKYKTILKFDFGIYDDSNKLKYLIEFDGEQHFRPIDFFGGQENFILQQERDNIKNNYCKENNIPLLRIPYTKLNNLTINDLIL